jgi:hypothetical protein
MCPHCATTSDGDETSNFACCSDPFHEHFMAQHECHNRAIGHFFLWVAGLPIQYAPFNRNAKIHAKIAEKFLPGDHATVNARRANKGINGPARQSPKHAP